MKPILKTALLIATTLPSLAARAAEIDNPDDCPRPVESDGQSICLFDGGTDPWLDQAWDQTGPNTWTNPEDGTQSTWHETAPNEYEIVDTNLADQEGAVVPVPPPPAPPVQPPPPPPDAQLPVLPGDPPLDVTVGDYSLSDAQWTGSATGREGPFGVTRLIGMPPTAAQYAELEFAWAMYKANSTRPHRHAGILVDEIATDVSVTPPPPRVSGDHHVDEALYQAALREREYESYLAAGLDPSIMACAPECGPFWDGMVVVGAIARDAAGFLFSELWTPGSTRTIDDLASTVWSVVDRIDHLTFEYFMDLYMNNVAQPVVQETATGESYLGDIGLGYSLGRALIWFHDLVDPRDGHSLTDGEVLYRQTVIPFMKRVVRAALVLAVSGEITTEQAVHAVFVIGMRYHGVLVEPPLLPGAVDASELGGLRPVAGALYVTSH